MSTQENEFQLECIKSLSESEKTLRNDVSMTPIVQHRYRALRLLRSFHATVECVNDRLKPSHWKGPVALITDKVSVNAVIHQAIFKPNISTLTAVKSEALTWNVAWNKLPFAKPVMVLATD